MVHLVKVILTRLRQKIKIGIHILIRIKVRIG